MRIIKTIKRVKWLELGLIRVKGRGIRRLELVGLLLGNYLIKEEEGLCRAGVIKADG